MEKNFEPLNFTQIAGYLHDLPNKAVVVSLLMNL